MESRAARRPTLWTPWATHVGVMLGFTLWWWFGTLEQYGVDAGAEVWDPTLNGPAAVLTGGVVILLGVPLGWNGAWAIHHGVRCGARLLAATYVLLAGIVAHVFAGLRFWGDTSPTDLTDLTFAWVVYPGRRWAKRFGLVE